MNLQRRDFGGRTAFSGRIATVHCFQDNVVLRAMLGEDAEGTRDVPVQVGGAVFVPGAILYADADGVLVSRKST